MYFFLISFSLLGAGIKYIDSAYDDKAFNKKLALIIAPILGLLWSYTMIINPIAATILLSIVLGVVLKGKIDNYAHLIGVAIIVPIIFFAGVELMILPLVFLSAVAILDEVGNDYIGSTKRKIGKYKVFNNFITYFFDHRWLLKIAILFLVILNMMPFYFFVSMILFDYAYLGIRVWSDIRLGKEFSVFNYNIKLKNNITSNNPS